MITSTHSNRLSTKGGTYPASGEITNSSLRRLHQQTVENGQDNAIHINRLIHILGGIDNVLRDYLSEANAVFSLDQKQLTDIHEVLVDKSRQITAGTLMLEINNNMNIHSKYKCGELHYEFYDSDSYLNAIFSDGIASKLHKLSRSWIVHTINAATSLIYFLLFPILINIISNCLPIGTHV